MQCPFCDKKKPRPNLTQLDKFEDHLVVVVNSEGVEHVHAPFDKKNMIMKMISALIVEAEKNGIVYPHAIPKTQGLEGN